MVPDPWAFALLALAAFRWWKLLAEDQILDRPRDWVIARSPDWFLDQLGCPWCAGFWICLEWYLAFVVWPHGTLIVATPFALSAVVGIIGHYLAR